MTQIMTIEQEHDIHVDAVLSHNDELLFLSCFATDTFAQNLIAKMSLPLKDGGLIGDTITILASGGRALPLKIPDRKLRKKSGATPPHSLFSNRLVHLQIYDEVLIQPDKATRRAALIRREEETAEWEADQLWTLLHETLPLPLLDEWRDDLLSAFWGEGWLSELTGVGVQGVMLNVADVPINDWMTDWLREKFRYDQQSAITTTNGKPLIH